MKTMSRACTAARYAALLAFAGATAAHAASVTVPVGGTLLADGAGVRFSVTFDCDSGWDAVAIAYAFQRVDDNRVATGSGVSNIVDCADGEETVEVDALATEPFLAFTEGEAMVRIGLSTCEAKTETCEEIWTNGEVQFD